MSEWCAFVFASMWRYVRQLCTQYINLGGDWTNNSNKTRWSKTKEQQQKRFSERARKKRAHRNGKTSILYVDRQAAQLLGQTRTNPLFVSLFSFFLTNADAQCSKAFETALKSFYFRIGCENKRIEGRWWWWQVAERENENESKAKSERKSTGWKIDCNCKLWQRVHRSWKWNVWNIYNFNWLNLPIDQQCATSYWSQLCTFVQLYLVRAIEHTCTHCFRFRISVFSKIKIAAAMR